MTDPKLGADAKPPDPEGAAATANRVELVATEPLVYVTSDSDNGRDSNDRDSDDREKYNEKNGGSASDADVKLARSRSQGQAQLAPAATRFTNALVGVQRRRHRV